MRMTVLIALTLATGMVLQSTSVAQQPIEPSREHLALKNDVGTWDARMKLYLAGPDGEATEIQAVETNTMLGDFWLMSRLEYEFFGQKMLGRGQFGFDPVRKKFVGTWCDTGSPYMSTMEGDWDEASKTWTYTMKGYDEAGNPTSGKLVTQIRDSDHKTFTMYMNVPGSDQPVRIMVVD